MAVSWKEVRDDLHLSKEDEENIALEKELIKTLVTIREQKGLTQIQLADMCHIKQSVLARLESSAHSPRINSLLKVLVPMGYTLQIVPLKKEP